MIDKKQLSLKIKRNLSQIYGVGFKKFGNKAVIDTPLYISNKRYISIGKNVCIHKNARIECFEEYSPNLIIGNNVGIGYNFQCLVTANCIIGDNTLMASNILITTENHGIDPKKNYAEQQLLSKDVEIGRNCWIGEKVIILPGVIIGDNVIIGAGSVVTKSFGDNVIIAGCPAKCIKKYNFSKNYWEKI